MCDIEKDLRALLAGEVVPIQNVNISYLTASQKKSTQGHFKPIVKRTVCYIAMALVFDEEGQIVLVQEAKESCFGKWYLPAGRIEPGENLIDGVKREVLEEAGLEFEPTTLLCVNMQGLSWYRFVFIGRATGGTLKTLEQKDKESLQAKWFKVNEVLSDGVKLRHKDFFKSLRFALAYMSQDLGNRHPAYQIGIQPHPHILHRPVIVRNGTDRCVEILCDTENGLPCCHVTPEDFHLLDSLHYVFRDVFNYTPPSGQVQATLRGLLTIEHCGIPAREHDGICFTSVVILNNTMSEKLEEMKNSAFKWHRITDSDLLSEFSRRISGENLLIPAGLC